ncbi:MAG: bifunctional GTP diphosphokinase/guanosine-3',5'-bis pyrophosphate 3'-pyrophosphohydrolase [Pseudomonadota bacterium]
MYLFSGLEEKLNEYLSEEQVNQIRKAYCLAKDSHEGQLRSSGDPYITHPVAVARILAEMRLDVQSIMAALLHDVIEDTDVTREDIAQDFGEQVARLVEGVTKLTQIKFRSRAEAQAENFRKMMMAMTQDIRVILIKLADRLHNMRTLGALRLDKRSRIAKETSEIYSPIANRLGLYDVRAELDELAFNTMHPGRFRVLKEAVIKSRGNRKQLVGEIQSQIENCITNAGLHCKVEGREKLLSSIYRKMRGKRMAFKDIMDVYGFRIIVDTVDGCYRVLGLMHNLYSPVIGRFKDYIAIPKANGYQSLHTSLVGPHGVHVEVQIRTQEMHYMAHSGVAAHWLYKSGVETNQAEIRAREWMRNLIEFQKNAGDSIEFIENVKIDLFPDEVYVFTPHGKIMELPSGATPVDFAFHIHTDIGNSCVAAKVDRQLVPLSTPLSNGQTVEIITASGARPNPSWLSFVVTGKARSNIRHFIKNLKYDEAVNLGKKLVEKALDPMTLNQFSEDTIRLVVRAMKKGSIESVFADVGLGTISPIIMATQLIQASSGSDETHDIRPESVKPLAIKGTEGLILTFSHCCRPIPGDTIVGVINQGNGIAIHRSECKKIVDVRKRPEKCISVEWEDTTEGDFKVGLMVDVFNRRGVLAQLTNMISNQDANIINIEIDERDGSHNVITFLLGVSNRVHLATIIKKIRVMPFTNKITRMPS